MAEEAQSPRLLERFREVMRLKHLSFKTEKFYLYYIVTVQRGVRSNNHFYFFSEHSLTLFDLGEKEDIKQHLSVN